MDSEAGKATLMVHRTSSAGSVASLIQIMLPLLCLGLLIALCAQLLVPFVGLLLWTAILAICFHPVHTGLMARGMSTALSAALIGIVLAAVVLVPVAIAALSASRNIPDMISALQSGEQQIPPPSADLLRIPAVGPKIYALWTQASNDMNAFVHNFAPQLTTSAKWVVAQAGGMLTAVLGLVLAVILAAITLAHAVSARAFVAQIFAHLTGDHIRGEHYMSVIGATIRSVANGVIGVAFVQALLCGIGFFLVGIPGAGILSLLAMVLGVLQVPVLLVTLPAIIYAFSDKSPAVAILFAIWFVVAGLSDAVLKPMMIGRGLEVPMPIILLGVIGGVIAYGLVGLFIGAVLLAVGWVLLREWLDAPLPVSAGSAADLPVEL
jgi:predicted PurR-regulated permease PerM